MIRARFIAPCIAILGAIFWYTGVSAAIQQPFEDATSSNPGIHDIQVFQVITTTTVDTLIKDTPSVLGSSNGATLFEVGTSTCPTSFADGGIGGIPCKGGTTAILSMGGYNTTCAALPCTMPFTASTTLKAGYFYELDVGRNFAGPYIDWYATNVDTFLTGAQRYLCDGANCVQQNTGEGWQFRLTSGATDTNTITFTYPFSSTTEDFQNWSVNVNLNATSTVAPFVRIAYSVNGETTSDTHTLASSTGFLENFPVTKGMALTPFISSTITHVVAQAFLDDFTTPEKIGTYHIASSSILTFNINWQPPFSYPSGTIPYAPTCPPPASITDIGGYLTYAICGMFMPSPTGQKILRDLGTELSEKAPWGYITAATNAINGVSASSSASSSIAMIGSTFTGFLAPLRDILALLIWGTFGFWVVNRLKHVHT